MMLNKFRTLAVAVPLVACLLGRQCQSAEPATESRGTILSTIKVASAMAPLEMRPAVPVLRIDESGALSGITGYAGHRVGGGETLREIALQGGSAPSLISAYNRTQAAALPGQMLIIPQVQGTNSTLKSQPCVVERGPQTLPQVALTIDAGSDADPVPQILATLRERQIKLTFFLTGKFIETYPDLVRQMAADGHEFGNHSWSHPDLRKCSSDQIQRELLDTERLLNRTAGATTRPFFRPPYGEYDNHVLLAAEDAGFLPVYWTLDALDSVGRTKFASFLVERVTSRLPEEEMRGAIILMHCGNASTAEALPSILDRFSRMRLQVVPLSHLLRAE
jgi:peptidoglycan/xylan/chitin deacetylase (PgdA/CDA1 family)